jgi:hypothetical protein
MRLKLKDVKSEKYRIYLFEIIVREKWKGGREKKDGVRGGGM